MVVGDRRVLIHELGTVIRSATGHARDVLRRGSPNFGLSEDRVGRPIGWIDSKGWPALHADETILARATKTLQALEGTTAKAPDLAAVMWAFGRSCVASTARDALLDAVVGLERLVVPGEPGENAYKFRLHGQALLREEGNVFDELRKLYSLRSNVAHGGRHKKNTTSAIGSAAPRARTLLAKAIEAAVHLVSNGEIRLGDDGDIAAAIAQLVLSRATRSP